MELDIKDRMAVPRAAYVHIPFCVSKCHYCDFNSYQGMEPLFDDYIHALTLEIRRIPDIIRPDRPIPLDSVYVGGGTPTILSADQLSAVLHALDENIGLAENCEITLEANPGTIDEYKLVQLYTAKFNRISIGIQSFDDELLSKLGRIHTAEQAIEAYYAARRAGFSNVGIDLMFALPGQNVKHWGKTLDKAIELNPEHISLYELSIEEGTQFASLCLEDKLDLPNEDTQLDMYELAIAKLTQAGFEHYEVSNFARPGFRSGHNQVYWRNEPHYAFGAGASSYINGDRARRISNPRDYINAIISGSHAIDFSEHLTGRALLAETIALGLRVLDGIEMSKNKWQAYTDIRVIFAPEIKHLQEKGLLELIDGHLRVTHKGLLLLNDVAEEFLP